MQLAPSRSAAEGGETAVARALLRADAGAGQHVRPFELFFDLVFVFAFTQVTSFLSDHLTWTGMLHGVALLAALWWAWVCYSLLTNADPPTSSMRASRSSTSRSRV